MGQSGYGGNGGFSSSTQNLHKQLVGYQLQQQGIKSPVPNNRMSPLLA